MSWDILPKSNLQYFLQKLKGKFDGKVDIVAGKGLSTNDYTTTEKNKLSGIESGAQVNPTIDSTLSSTSTNAVQNKVVKSALDGKADNSDVIETDTPNSTPFLYRQTPYEADRVFLDELVGGSVAWNQLAKEINTTNYRVVSGSGTIQDGVITISGNAIVDEKTGAKFTSITGHKYIIAFDYLNSIVGTSYFVPYPISSSIITIPTSNSYAKYIDIFNTTVGKTDTINFVVANYTSGSLSIKNFLFIDLTLMFGTTIADYVYSLEQATAGSGIAWLKSHGFFTKDYYPYNAGELISVKTSGKKVVGKNLLKDNFSAYTEKGAYRILENVVLEGKVARFTFTDKDTSVDVSGCYIGFYKDTNDITSAYRWCLNNGIIQSNTSNYSTNTEGELCGNVFIYPKTEETFNKIYSRYNVMVEYGSTATPYEPYTEHTYDISNIDLRGIPKLVNNELVYDGDTYDSNGDVTRKYGIVDLGTLNWSYNSARFYSNIVSLLKPVTSNTIIANIRCPKYTPTYVYLQTDRDDKTIGISNDGRVYIYDTAYSDSSTFTTAMSGVYLVYELATPTTETTDPFTNPQICDKDGTEEFIDDRTVPIPVGHNSTYANLPSIMDGDFLNYMAKNFASEEYVDHVLEEVDTELDTKVDKVAGKGLSTNDYTNEEKALVETIPDKADADDVKSTQTATGNPITLTDASETYAQGLSVELEPKQDLHGYDFPWVGGAGKNKLPLDLDTIKSLNTDGTWSGNSYTIYNFTYTVLTDNGGNVTGITGSGTPNGNNANLRLYGNLTVSENMIISGTPNVSSTDYLIEAYNPSVPAWYSDATPSSGANIPPCTLQHVNISARNGKTVSFTVRPMICSATAQNPTVFEKWSNICPISGYEGVEVEDVGKNLFDKNATPYLTGYYISDTSVGGEINTTSNSNYNVYRERIKPNSTYTFGLIKANSPKWAITDADGVIVKTANNYGGTDGVNITVQTEESGAYLYLSVGVSETYKCDDILQLEEGSTATPYEPYQSHTASVTFGQTVYGGSVDVTNGGTDDEWDIVTFTNEWSDEDIMQDGGHRYRYTGTASGIVPLVDIICDCFKGVKKNATDIKNGEISTTGSSAYPFIRVVTNMDFNDFKTFIVGKQACYKVAPSTIDTQPTNLKLLQDTNNLTTNGTTITLDYIPNNSIGDAVKASEEYTDRAIEAVESLIPQKTVLYDDVIDVGDDFTISIPSSFNYILFELSISSSSYYGTGSLMVTSWDDTLNILATSHESELRTCVLLPIRDRVEVYGDFMNEHGELKITAF